MSAQRGGDRSSSRAAAAPPGSPPRRSFKRQPINHNHTTRISTVPLIIYPNYLYAYGEFFMRTLTTLHAIQAKGWVGKRCAAAARG